MRSCVLHRIKLSKAVTDPYKSGIFIYLHKKNNPELVFGILENKLDEIKLLSDDAVLMPTKDTGIN